jgi:hypothetical protein
MVPRIMQLSLLPYYSGLPPSKAKRLPVPASRRSMQRNLTEGDPGNGVPSKTPAGIEADGAQMFKTKL